MKSRVRVLRGSLGAPIVLRRNMAWCFVVTHQREPDPLQVSPYLQRRLRTEAEVIQERRRRAAELASAQANAAAESRGGALSF